MFASPPLNLLQPLDISIAIIFDEFRKRNSKKKTMQPRVVTAFEISLVCIFLDGRSLARYFIEDIFQNLDFIPIERIVKSMTQARSQKINSIHSFPVASFSADSFPTNTWEDWVGQVSLINVSLLETNQTTLGEATKAGERWRDADQSGDHFHFLFEASTKDREREKKKKEQQLEPVFHFAEKENQWSSLKKKKKVMSFIYTCFTPFNKREFFF